MRTVQEELAARIFAAEENAQGQQALVQFGELTIADLSTQLSKQTAESAENSSAAQATIGMQAATIAEQQIALAMQLAQTIEVTTAHGSLGKMFDASHEFTNQIDTARTPKANVGGSAMWKARTETNKPEAETPTSQSQQNFNNS